MLRFTLLRVFAISALLVSVAVSTVATDFCNQVQLLAFLGPERVSVLGNGESIKQVWPIGALVAARYGMADRIEVDASGVALSADDWMALVNLPRLHELDVRWSNISDSAVAEIRYCSAMQDLDLSDTTSSRSAIWSACKNPGLRILRLRDTAADDAVCEALAGCADLRVVVLDGTNVTDRGVAALEALRHLEVLTVRRTDVDLGTMLSAQKMLAIRTLAVSESSLRPEDIEQAFEVPTLRILEYDGYLPLSTRARFAKAGVRCICEK